MKGEVTDKNKLEKLCISKKGKYCPLVLLYCGYYYECRGAEENCLLKTSLLKK